MNDQHKSSSLATLAMLKVNYDINKPYVDIFLPFVVDSFTNDDVHDIESIQNSVLNKYRLKIPLNSLKTILQQAEKGGFLRDVGRQHIAEYAVNRAKAESLNYNKRRSKASREQGELLERLIDYCSQIHKTSLSTKDAEIALFNYITEVSHLNCRYEFHKIAGLWHALSYR